MSQRLRFVLFACVACLVLGACGGDDSAETEAGLPSETAAPDEAESEASDDDASTDLDVDALNPCVLEPSEIQTLRQLNADAIGDFGTVAGPGTPTEGGLPTCEYVLTFEDAPSSTFGVVLLSTSREDEECFVVHRGVCVTPDTTYTDADDVIEFDVPPEITQAVKARLDAQAQ